MAQNQGTQNPPSHETQVKGGEHTHQDGNKTTNQPSRETPMKGGQPSHSGGQR